MNREALIKKGLAYTRDVKSLMGLTQTLLKSRRANIELMRYQKNLLEGEEKERCIRTIRNLMDQGDDVDDQVLSYRQFIPKL